MIRFDDDLEGAISSLINACMYYARKRDAYCTAPLGIDREEEARLLSVCKEAVDNMAKCELKLRGDIVRFALRSHPSDGRS